MESYFQQTLILLELMSLIFSNHSKDGKTHWTHPKYPARDMWTCDKTDLKEARSWTRSELCGHALVTKKNGTRVHASRKTPGPLKGQSVRRPYEIETKQNNRQLASINGRVKPLAALIVCLIFPRLDILKKKSCRQQTNNKPKSNFGYMNLVWFLLRLVMADVISQALWLYRLAADMLLILSVLVG